MRRLTFVQSPPDIVKLQTRNQGGTRIWSRGPSPRRCGAISNQVERNQICTRRKSETLEAAHTVHTQVPTQEAMNKLIAVAFSQFKPRVEAPH